MASQAQLEFAIKAKNEAGIALKDVEGDLGKVEKAAFDADKDVRNFGQGLDDVGEAGGNAESALRGVGDLAGVASAQFGLSLGPMDQYVGSLGEIGGGVESLVKGGPAFLSQLAAWTVATWAQVTALIAQGVAFAVANAPIILIVAGIALLVAGVILLIKYWDEIVEKFPILGEIADKLKAKFEEVKAWFESSFMPGFNALMDSWVAGFQKVVDFVNNVLIPLFMPIANAVAAAGAAAVGFIQQHWGTIEAIIGGYVRAWLVIIETVWNQIQTVFETAFGIITGITNVFVGIFTGDWERAWLGVKQIVEAVWDGIKGSIENAIGLIKGLAPLILDAGKALGEALFEGLKSALSATAGFAGDVASAVLNAIKHVINTFVIDPINSSLEFKIKIPGAPDININPPDIPRLAMGGIVTRPTIALIGEAGPEAVIPLSRGGVGGTTINIHVHGSINGVDDLMYQMDRALKRAGQAGLVR